MKLFIIHWVTTPNQPLTGTFRPLGYDYRNNPRWIVVGVEGLDLRGPRRDTPANAK